MLKKGNDADAHERYARSTDIPDAVRWLSGAERRVFDFYWLSHYDGHHGRYDFQSSRVLGMYAGVAASNARKIRGKLVRLGILRKTAAGYQVVVGDKPSPYFTKGWVVSVPWGEREAALRAMWEKPPADVAPAPRKRQARRPEEPAPAVHDPAALPAFRPLRDSPLATVPPSTLAPPQDTALPACDFSAIVALGQTDPVGALAQLDEIGKTAPGLPVTLAREAVLFAARLRRKGGRA